MTTDSLTALKLQLPNVPIAQIADIIRKDWKNLSPYAQPYLEAMFTLSSIDDQYGLGSGKEVVLRFLCNASGWRGEVARLVKAELKKRAGV